jgi:hypothetical protein
MTQDIPFMERRDWLDADGKCKFKLFCPVSATVVAKRVRATQRPNAGKAINDAEELSALELQYDRELHEMVGYMRRLDGAFGLTKKQMRVMDPLATDGDVKWSIDGSQTDFFGYWAYDAWHKVFAPVLSKTFGQVVNVSDKEKLMNLLGAEVMM